MVIVAPQVCAAVTLLSKHPPICIILIGMSYQNLTSRIRVVQGRPTLKSPLINSDSDPSIALSVGLR